MSADPKLEQLKARLAEVTDLSKASTLLFWDQRVMMPPGGAAARAEALSTLSSLTQERFVAPDIGALLEDLRGLEESSEHDSFEASLIRVTRRDYEKATRVPPELVGEMSRTAALALSAWGPAKEQSNFELLRPHLESHLELKRRYIACFDPADEDYDVLLDNYEPDMKAAEVREIFEQLKQELVPLVTEIGEAGEVDDSFLRQAFDPAAQREFGLQVLRRFGYTGEEWRLDQTSHPFQATPGYADIRLTTNFRPHDLTSLFATMHEFGHGIYERGVDASLARTPLGSGVSLGVHESQSRTWENLVGRSRPFWRYFYPAGGVSGAVRVRERGALLPGHQQGAPLADPDRRRRGDLQHAHHPSLRARAGADRGPPSGQGAAGGLERSDGRVPRGRGPGRRARCAAGHALGRRELRLLPDVLPRQRHLRPDLGEAKGGPR
jgi:carboxypeptidase Taq